MRLPSKDSATWRAIITGLQTFSGFLIALVATPEAMKVIVDYYPQFVPAITVGATIAAFVWNLTRKDVDNY